MASNTESITLEQVILALLQLPQKTIDLLSLGPISDYEGVRGCRLCDTMAKTIDPDNTRQIQLANVLLDYHDVDGSTGPECYRRCCEIYLAAGWGQ